MPTAPRTTSIPSCSTDRGRPPLRPRDAVERAGNRLPHPASLFVILAAGVVLLSAVLNAAGLTVTHPSAGQSVTVTNPTEWRGLGWAFAVTAALVAIVLAGLVPANGFLQDPERPGFVGSFFLRGLVFWIFVFGLLPGIAYGVAAGTITRDADVYKGMQKNMEVIAGYIVVVCFIAQFINIFNWSNLGVLLAVNGAATLGALDLGPIPLLVGLILVTGFIDLMIGSASAKWAMLGPVLVPMFMLLGYSPELTQTAYRLGDSLTNILTPLSSNFPLVLMFFQRYVPRAGIGTVTATMLPYSVANLVCWTLMLLAWVQLGWPTGPGAPLFLLKN